jgi:beta-fructofuranosidase
MTQYLLKRIGWAALFLHGLSPSAVAAQPAFNDAVALWHFQTVDDAAGANSSLNVQGPVVLGQPCDDAKAASVARGGDGCVAECAGGFLVAGQGADGELNLTCGALSLYVRLQNRTPDWTGCGIVSKHGGHDRLTYNLYGNAGTLGFELGTDEGLFRVDVPAVSIGAADWHDVIVRYDGRMLEMFVDGVLVADQSATGSLRAGNTEPLVLAGYSLGGQLRGPFQGRLDTVALWKRALNEGEIVAHSGGEAEVQRSREARRATQYANLPGPVAEFRKVVKSTDVANYSRAALALRRWMIENDPHRPLYHFTGPESWINDPNGPIYHQGQYHLFYQFAPLLPDRHGGWRRSPMCWGHAVSADLVHWVDWPVAVWPDTPYDREGVYSGNTVIDPQGFPCALYTGNVAGHRETYGMLARSTDGWITWRKTMVMDNAQRPNADSPVHWDGHVWRDGDRWCQLVGGTTGGSDRQGAAWLWTSTDLQHWTLQKNIAPSIKLGAYWELPYLIPLGGRHVLLAGCGNPGWVGTYDAQALRFTPDDPRPASIDNGTYYSFNVNMVDDHGPGGSRRQLMHGWVTGPESPTKATPYWQGAHSIPRVLSLPGKHVLQQPIPEIEVLRGRHQRFAGLTVEPSRVGYLPESRGDAVELIAVFNRGASKAARFGLKLRVSADGKEAVRVWYDPQTDQFGLDGAVTQKASAWAGLTRDGSGNQRINVRVFLDRSILEVYCSGAALTGRAFPTCEALGMDLFAEGGAASLTSLDIWSMHSMWSDVPD